MSQLSRVREPSGTGLDRTGPDTRVWGSDLIVHQQLGTFEVARRHPDVVLLRRVVELCQAPVDETQLRTETTSSDDSRREHKQLVKGLSYRCACCPLADKKENAFFLVCFLRFKCWELAQQPTGCVPVRISG